MTHADHPARAAAGRVEELAGLGTWRLDLRTGAVTGNSTFWVLLDLAPDAPAPTMPDYLRAVHPQDRAEVQAAWDALLRHGEEYVLEHRLLLPGGRLKYMRAVASVDRDDEGRPAVASGITQDITGVRLAALEVERERDRSRAVLASLQDGFLITFGGVVLEVNSGLCAMTGFSAAELAGTRCPLPFWPAQPASDVLAGGPPPGASGVQRDADLVRKDGSPFCAHLSTTALPDVDGVRLLLTTVRDTSQQRAYERLLVARAESDPLTGVRNSRAFRDALRLAVEDARAGEPLALALLDIDHFKAVNDSHGHAVGDEVLCAFVARVRSVTDRAGVLARVGGEEFALLLPRTGPAVARELVERVLAVVRRTPFPWAGTVTVSAGLAHWAPGTGDDELYRSADRQLYAAKAGGRDQVH